MKKILIRLIVPALGEQYEVLVPGFLQVNKASELISNSLAELTNHRFVPAECQLLCMENRGGALDFSSTLWECGIQDGDKIYLI